MTPTRTPIAPSGCTLRNGSELCCPQWCAAGAATLVGLAKRPIAVGVGKPLPRSPSPSYGDGVRGRGLKYAAPSPPFPLSLVWRWGHRQKQATRTDSPCLRGRSVLVVLLTTLGLECLS